jgi:hypothetical protein
MSNINTLQSIGNDLNAQYDNLKSINSGSYSNTNPSSIESIIQAINERIS